jgi:anti-anti-sigma factor
VTTFLAIRLFCAEREAKTMEQKFFLHGEIDLASADGVLDAVLRFADRHPGHVVVDCTDVTFIDATGLSVLLRARGELARQNRDLRLEHPSPILIQMVGLFDLRELLEPITRTAADTPTP